MKKKQKKALRVVKNAFLIVTVIAAGMFAVTTFFNLASMEWTWKQFAVNGIVFLLSMEYIMLFMWANDGFTDDYGFVFGRFLEGYEDDETR